MQCRELTFNNLNHPHVICYIMKIQRIARFLLSEPTTCTPDLLSFMLGQAPRILPTADEVHRLCHPAMTQRLRSLSALHILRCVADHPVKATKAITLYPATNRTFWETKALLLRNTIGTLQTEGAIKNIVQSYLLFLNQIEILNANYCDVPFLDLCNTWYLNELICGPSTENVYAKTTSNVLIARNMNNIELNLNDVYELKNVRHLDLENSLCKSTQIYLSQCQFVNLEGSNIQRVVFEDCEGDPFSVDFRTDVSETIRQCLRDHYHPDHFVFIAPDGIRYEG